MNIRKVIKISMLCLLVTWGLPAVGNAQAVLSNEYSEVPSLTGATVQMYGNSELRITNGGTPISGCTINMNSIDSWVFLPNVIPSSTIALLGQFRVNGAAAVNDSNVKVVQYGQGAVVIPYPSDFQPLEVFEDENFIGASMNLSPYTGYGTVLSGNISSFVLKRGYTATLSNSSNGSGFSINYVAADGDLKVGALPAGLNNQVKFIRIYPWRWVAKKGSCDVGPWDLDAQWYYDWAINWNPASPDFEYVGIKQQRWWPGLPDPGAAAYLGINHISGYNEPNNPVEDAYESLDGGQVSIAVGAWPELEGTGMRIGAPAVTDGGYGWIVDFINQAEAAGRRVDYVPIHYYRSYWNKDDPAGAANQLYWFLKGIYDATHKPIWLTEFNNGANWTDNAHDPDVTQNRNAIEAMINMMDNSPWMERYSIYSRVEWFRQTHYDDGNITPMGQMYKDHESPIGYQQILPGEGMNPSASYDFESNLDDDSGSGNHAVSKNHPEFTAGHTGGTALSFDGMGDHVILPDSLSDSTDFTFAAWVYWTGGSAWQRIFDFGIMDSAEYMFLTPMTDSGSGSTLRFSMTTGGWGGEQRLSAASALPQNAWTHVAVTISGNTGRLFVNGAQVAVNTSMTLNPNNLGAIQHYLGRSQFKSDPYFGGRIDDVIIKNQALSAAQIAALAAGNQPPQATATSVDGGSVGLGDSYSGSVSGLVTDPESGAITYSKVYGPSWLAVSSNGSLSGIPGYADRGAQHATIRATDPAGNSTYLLLSVLVEAPPFDFTSGPVAYWTFDAAASTDDGWIPGNGSRADLDGDGSMDLDDFRIGAADLSGNGNHLTAWTSDWMKWSADSPMGDFSMKAGNPYPAAGTDSTYNPAIQTAGYTNINAEAITPAEWTIEAVFKSTNPGGYQTMVGRDGNYENFAALYFSMVNTDLRILYVDVAGNSHNLQVAAGLTSNTWYHAAATSDGSTLRLWLDDSEIGSLDVSGSADSALAEGYGTWSVARGLWASAGWDSGHTDRFNGLIDAVAISGVALSPGSFVTETFGMSGYNQYASSFGIPGAAFEGDANSNGIPNGMEYYLGWDPTGLSPTDNLFTWTNNYLAVVHPFNPSASAVTGRVEWTTDLMAGNWSDMDVTYVTNESLGEIGAILGAETTNQLFIRLKVEN